MALSRSAGGESRLGLNYRAPRGERYGGTLPDLAEELSGFSEQASHASLPLKRLFRISPVFKRILVAARRS